TGSAACPFSTIRAALDAKPPRGATIHLAAGTYDAAHGEKFPIVLRDGLSLRGAGREKTTIRGAGLYDRAGLGDRNRDNVYVTLLVGDAAAAGEIADVTLDAGTNGAQRSYVGVFCDRGNARPPSQPSPSPSTTLTRLAIEQYDTALSTTTSKVPTLS